MARRFDHLHFSLQRQCSRLAEKHECLGRIAYDHAHHCVIHRIGDGQRENIDLRLREFLPVTA